MKVISISKEELLNIDLSEMKDLISYPSQWAINILFHILADEDVETLSPLPPDSSCSLWYSILFVLLTTNAQTSDIRSLSIKCGRTGD